MRGRGSGLADSQKKVVGEIFREALASNTSLGGDTCNRGMLLGSILGGVIGASNIPQDLLEGLVRGAELRSAVKALSARIISTSRASTNSSPPAPLPRLYYSSEVGLGVNLPRDFGEKFVALQRDAFEAGVPIRNLVYANPRSALSPKAYALNFGKFGALTATPIRLRDHSKFNGSQELLLLEEGDARKDRVEFSGGTDDTSKAEAKEISELIGSMIWESSVPMESEGQTREGTGIFFYAHPRELFLRKKKTAAGAL